ncbi:MULTISPECIES: 16S rRNA (guanine(966)-N(2))-methyltransferase RsmD [Nitrosomonas]|uniref:16S rRNA (Guanine(966)-N(2))-methyltransferase RsmD n=2 Tax=Nitrosomonas communis TaxID=44574 RepID=A0A5D3Y8Y6_9PROT|nr:MULTISPECIES: 16S rRNA (guanine(966)-N(2))-methyltransferase RsmD [Nitrosomonas]TYP81083.1 16S rRNA (guanine(966)-N(2))-methyltransferase RsmD [Nitrosomonas communis]
MQKVPLVFSIIDQEKTEFDVVGFMVREGKVRIIGGKWRSRVITFPDEKYLRPTPDRVRGTVFNWLGQDLTGKYCLDLFAGSGAMGFEAASRGAERVVMVELSRSIMHQLDATRQKLDAVQVELVQMDALAFIASDVRQYDVIFLDPPFQFNLLPDLLMQLPSHMTGDGLVYIENDHKFDLDEQWLVWRSGRAGKVYHHLLKLKKNG